MKNLLLIFSAFAFGVPVCWCNAGECPRWGRFEVSITNSKAYGDPYRDATLDAEFTRPDGSRVTFWGFYDGEQQWKLRFMPDQTGTWNYRATFSDGSPGAKGSFECVASGMPGMIAVHEANPIWFGFKTGAPLLVRALHVGDRFFARNWDNPADPNDQNLRAAFLDWAAAQGYNTLSIASHYLNRQAPGRGKGWDTPRLWPLNAAEFRSLEAMLDDLADRRLVVYPFAGFFGRNSDFPKESADQTLYIRYTYARLGPCWNLMLNASGPEPLLHGKPFLSFEEVNKLGAEIQRWNVFGKPLSVHNRTLGEDEFRKQTWLTYSTVQGPKTVDRASLGRKLVTNRHPSKPLLAQETLWSGNVNHIRAIKRDYSDDDLRKNTFVIHFSGAGIVFADNDGDSSSGFSGSLDIKDARQSRHDVMKNAWDICATLPFGHLKPRPDLVKGAHAHCLAAPGFEYLVYLTESQPVGITLADGPFKAIWIDARTGKHHPVAAATVSGDHLMPPARGDDWILHLKRE